MRGRRLWQFLRLYLTLSVGKRTKYLRDNKVFASLGENSLIMDRKIPLYAKLISIGNNVHIASDVSLVTHDVTHVVINNKLKNEKCGGRVNETIGCIRIGDNVFIGSHTTILGNVLIGSNVVIGACSLVNHDVPDNVVVAGVPAKVICSFDDFLKKRLSEESYPKELKPKREEVSEELVKWCWTKFNRERNLN